MNPVHVSLAALGGRGHVEAMQAATHGLSEPLLGSLSLKHVQLVPQCRGMLTMETARDLRAAFPATRFRLHANVQVLPRRAIVDLAQFDPATPFWSNMATISHALDAPAYTAHAGQRQHATLPEVLDNTRRAADLFGCRVGVEGHYPTPRGIFLIDSWQDYATLLESGVDYALDLSHLNIVAVQSGRVETQLVAEMLSAPQCIEVHLSANTGKSDAHQTLVHPPWWWSLMKSINEHATIFSEGKQPH